MKHLLLLFILNYSAHRIWLAACLCKHSFLGIQTLGLYHWFWGLFLCEHRASSVFVSVFTACYLPFSRLQFIGWSWRRSCPKEIDILTITSVAWGKKLINFWFFLLLTYPRLIIIVFQSWCSKFYMELRLFFLLFGPICPAFYKVLFSFLALYCI